MCLLPCSKGLRGTRVGVGPRLKWLYLFALISYLCIWNQQSPTWPPIIRRCVIVMEILSILWRPGRSRCDKDRGQTFSGRRWCFCVSLLLLHEQIQRFLNTSRAHRKGRKLCYLPCCWWRQGVSGGMQLFVSPPVLLSPAQWKFTSVFDKILNLFSFYWDAYGNHGYFVSDLVNSWRKLFF